MLSRICHGQCKFCGTQCASMHRLKELISSRFGMCTQLEECNFCGILTTPIPPSSKGLILIRFGTWKGKQIGDTFFYGHPSVAIPTVHQI